MEYNHTLDPIQEIQNDIDSKIIQLSNLTAEKLRLVDNTLGACLGSYPYRGEIISIKGVKSIESNGIVCMFKEWEASGMLETVQRELTNIMINLMDRLGITEFTMPLDECRNKDIGQIICTVDYENNKFTVKKVE